MKIYCHVKYKELSEVVQKMLFDRGIFWNTGRGEINHYDSDSLCFWSNHDSGFCHSHQSYLEGASYEKVSIPEFIDRLEAHFKPIHKIQLTEEYLAEYKEGDTFVKVGCQNIPVGKIKELLNIL